MVSPTTLCHKELTSFNGPFYLWVLQGACASAPERRAEREAVAVLVAERRAEREAAERLSLAASAERRDERVARREERVARREEREAAERLSLTASAERREERETAERLSLTASAERREERETAERLSLAASAERLAEREQLVTSRLLKSKSGAPTLTSRAAHEESPSDGASPVPRTSPPTLQGGPASGRGAGRQRVDAAGSALSFEADTALRTAAASFSCSELTSSAEGRLFAEWDAAERLRQVVPAAAAAASSPPRNGAATPSATRVTRQPFPVDAFRFGDVVLHRQSAPLIPRELALCAPQVGEIPTVAAGTLANNYAVSVSVHAAQVLSAQSHWTALSRLDRGSSVDRNPVSLCLSFTVRAAADAGFTTTLDEQVAFAVVTGVPTDSHPGTEVVLISHASLRIMTGSLLEGATVVVVAKAFEALTHFPHSGVCECAQVLPLLPPQLPLWGGFGGVAGGGVRSVGCIQSGDFVRELNASEIGCGETAGGVGGSGQVEQVLAATAQPQARRAIEATCSVAAYSTAGESFSDGAGVADGPALTAPGLAADSSEPAAVFAKGFGLHRLMLSGSEASAFSFGGSALATPGSSSRLDQVPS